MILSIRGRKENNLKLLPLASIIGGMGADSCEDAWRTSHL